MTDAQKYEAKFQEMQIYVPFIQRVIEKLKVNNEQQADNPRKAQLQKMEMLYDLLTNKAKKIKMETLMKCEGVLIKLHAKIEKQTNLLQNEDSILTNVKLKQHMPNKPSTSATNKNKVQEVEDISGPASPPPEIIPVDVEQPVVIPTERRCSPILVKAVADNKTQHVKKVTDSHASENSKHSTTEQFQKIRQKVFSADHNQSSSSGATKHIAGQEKPAYHHHNRTQYESRQGSTPHNAKEHQPKHLNTSRQNSPLPREKSLPANMPPTPASKLQTVKVVITEPLPAHVKQQHFPTSSQYLPRTSICHNNLRTLPQVSQTNVDHNEAYSPEELWEQYNESHNKSHNTTAPSTPPVFSRLGDKVPEHSKDDRPSTSKASGRYTPIPDVLKSPPLSVSDINNLLIESGADKIPKDISEIGCRRTPKHEDNNHRRFEASPSNNSFEVVRKKLAQSARMNSPLSADKEERNMSPLPHERIALKYNPHPRQERLQSMSSTDGSECSTQSKINDPRIKLKMHTNSALNSPTQVVTSPNVNVLPAINFNDPRLKKQNLSSLTATATPPLPGKISAPATPPTQTSTPIIGFRIKDPRISRVQINPLCAVQTPPARRPSVNPPQYSSEENWDSEPEEKSRPPHKVDPRLAKRVHQQPKQENPFESNCANLTSKPPPNRRNSLSQSRFQMDSAAAHNRATSQPRFQLDSTASHNRSASQPRFQMNARPNNRAMSQPRFDRPNCSKLDTEENWDSDNDTNSSINKSYSQTNQQMKQNQHKQSPLNKETVPKSKKQRNRLLPAITHTVVNPPNSDTEEDWDSEPEIANAKPKALTNVESEGGNVKPNAVTNVETQLSFDKSSGVPPVMPAFHTHISPKGFASPVHNLPSPVPHNPYNQPTYPLVGPHSHTQFPVPNTAANNRFSSVLNDKSERIKYFEAKKQKSVQPRTYKEFREARERAQTQEAALKRAADEAEAKKRAAELKEVNKDKEITIQESEKKEQPRETPKKLDECKKGKTPNHIETTKPTSTQSQQDRHKKSTGAAESTLDKMYRTQNFNSSFPKSVTAFKIPKKKTEEKNKEASTKTNEGISITDKLIDKVPPKQPETNKISQTEVITEKTKSQSQESKDTDKGKNNKCNNNKKASEPAPSKPLEAEVSDKIEQNQVKPKGIKENLSTTKMHPNANSSQKEKPSNEATKDKQEKQTTATEDNKIETENNEKDSQKSQESLNENKDDKTADDSNKTSRDPRCRTKPPTKVNQNTNEQEQEKEKEPVLDKFKMFEEIVITSAEKEVTLKPQQNLSALDKFNKLTQELTPQPQRVLRRRNTMVVFDSAPLVDKDKLRKANALLFEDVQDEEKRKRKQAEEDRINARRNKHLEEMFKKTDDNCTVSTQNIITGKRRTRATINFNETANAINVFKHISVKETSLDNVNATTTSQAAQSLKLTRSNSKIKMKNLEDDNSDDENSDLTPSKSNIKDTAKTNKETKAAKTKATKETKAKDENKTEEPQPQPEPKTNAKTQKKRTAANIKVTAPNNNNKEDCQTSAAANIEHGFRPIPDDEHQNCAVSSTSTENSAEEEASCSTTSNNRSLKKESDDNEPTSTANKSNNATPTPEANVHVLNEIVDQILKPNADREHILGLLGQILSEERLELIKSLIESSNRQTEEQPTNKDETIKPKVIKEENNISPPTNKKHDEEEFEPDELKPLKSKSAVGGKKMNIPKKKRSELDRLNEDIRDMFICEGVLTATGRRMCTIMGKNVETEADKKSTKETTPAPLSEPENTSKRKEEKLKPPLNTRPLRRSLRSCKTNEETEDDALSILSRTTEESMDDLSTTTDTSNTMDTTPQRKMPILKPHTPIKIPEEVTAKVAKTKEPANKRKSDDKSAIKAKKSKTNHDETKEDSETEEKESETEVDEEKEENETKNETNEIALKNTNIHWHTQSKFTTWCMICDKRIPANSSSLHYNIHHGENYISRMAPVLLQRFKQGKLNQPLFGVKKAHKQSSWFYRCPFCLKYFNTPMSLWLEHFQNHTLELRYECSKCHRCSNRRPTISRHIKNCEGATILNSVVKLNVPTAIKAHVCHLCNFIQLKRFNLERHYVEQHHLDKKTVELLGYTITLFDVENVECVTENKAAERENEAWKSIEKDEQVIDIEDEDEEVTATNDNAIEKEDTQKSKQIKNEKNNPKPAKETEHKDEPENVVKSQESAKEVDEKISEIVEKNQKAKRILDLVESRGSENQNNEKKVVDKPIQSKDSQNLPGKDQTSHENIVTSNDTSKNDNVSLNNQASDKQQVISKTTLTKSLNDSQQGVQKADKTKQKETTNTLDTSKNNKICANSHTETKQSNTAKPESLNKTKQKEIKVLITTKEIQNSDAEQSQKDKTVIVLDLTESEPTSVGDCEVINEQSTYQDLQDELLALAAEAAAREGETENEAKDNSNQTPKSKTSLPHEKGNVNIKETNKETQKETAKDCSNTNYSAPQPQTTMSDLISSSIDMIYKRGDSVKRKSIGLEYAEAKKVRQNASNAFMPSRDENNYSPTIQILAQSIINIEDDTNEAEKMVNKPITMAERLSQRLKDSQNQNTTKDTAHMKPKENAFEKLINDTLLELEKEKDSVASSNSPSTAQPQVMELENNKELVSNTQIAQEKALPKASKEPTKSLHTNDIITVISDDEDWEDIEITETAPTTTSTNTGNIQKSKNKGLFQKFGMFKGNNTKSKKHLPPMVFMPKKKTKEKPLQSTTTPSPSPTNTTATTANNTTTLTATTHVPHTNSNAHLRFKPVINIMDDLLPDSPCNDPIDLVPELAPLEPLQDLNDISSILDSNLSAVNINAADHHTSIEDALDFISEQQANDKQKSNSSAMKSQGKSVINNISHVGYSVQTTGENAFKFYCLLQNCSFLYSSDSVGLETHFMCEHAQIKWNGYCLICQTHCFSDAEASTEYSISKEIHHMMEKHANKQLLELNTDSTQHSTTSSQVSEERPKIKLRRMTGDCLSRATPDIEVNESASKTNDPPAMSMLGALLVAKPKPPTKDMPPQPQMPLTEPLLLDNNTEDRPFRNVNGDFLITSVTSSSHRAKQNPLHISNVVSLTRPTSTPTTPTPEQLQIPKISNVRTLAPKSGSLWSQQIEKESHELVEAAAESLEVSRILANAGNPSTEREVPRTMDDSPVIVAETLPLAQATTGDFVVTQTVSAQYNEFSSAALGFNISIAATTSGNPTAAPTPNLEAIPSITSRQYKCMGSGCKFVSRVPVAMSDHLRFHERRNFSNKQDYLSCGFCFYCASDIEDYMKHADQFHIINKTGYTPAPVPPTAARETDTATSLTKKIHDILNSSNNSTIVHNRNVYQSNFPSQQTPQVQDTEEVYLKKLRDTIDETVGPTGLADDKLYRCVIKSCHTQLTESTFISHIMFHISTKGGNPNNFFFKCPHCTAQYHRAAGIKAHIKNHARNRFFCYLCEETSTNPGQLLKHFSEKHWDTLNMYTKELLKPKTSTDGSEQVLDSGYYVAYTQELTDDEVRKFGEKLILEWQRKKSGSKTHFKSSEIELLPLPAIFVREVNCGECKYKTKVRTNMVRHLQMHKQNPTSGNKTGVASKVYSVDPVNPVPCLNSSERFFDKMTNLASSSLIPSTSASAASATKSTFIIPYRLLENNCYTCGCYGCNYHTISKQLFRIHMSTQHSAAMTYRCTFCQEQVCKRGITMDRILNHLRFHGAIIYRCEECNYIHYLRNFVEKHINDQHASLKVNIVTHERSSEDNPEGTTTAVAFAGKKYKEPLETNQPAPTSTTVTRSSNSDGSVAKPIATYGNTSKGKGKWICDVCGQKANTVGQMQTHCQQQHGVKNQYKCAHCNFGSQQLSQILSHIDDKHSGKTREACYMYHKSVNTSEEVTDTRPLWQRNDPTRVRHIRGILMEDEELALSEDVDDEDPQKNVEEQDEEVNKSNYISGYEFGCYHCGFKTQMFEDLKNQHHVAVHCCHLETAKPFWYRLHRRLCCPECRAFIGNNSELQQHLQSEHKKTRFYAADITMAENNDSSQRIMCGYCSFHCADAESLHRHHLRVQHWPQDIRIDNDEQIMDILALGKPEPSYQCTLCADIFANRVAIVQHACNVHSGEEGFSFRELTNVLIFRCNNCRFTCTTEMDLLRHMIDHYSRFKICNFCNQHQSSFNVYMQHCYAEHRNDIQRFRTIYPFREIRKFLLQMLIVFPSGLVLNKRNLFNTKYGRTEVIDEVYEEIYKISQQPPIPRLSIARLVARKSIEAQQKPTASVQDEILEAMQTRPKPPISKRRRTVVLNVEDLYTNSTPSLPKPKVSIVEAKRTGAPITKRRTTVDHDNLLTQQQQQQELNEFNAPLQQAKISKRRRTVAVDRDTLFSTNLSSHSTHSLLIDKNVSQKKRKTSHTPSPKHIQEPYPLNLDLEPFSFYGQIPEELDLSKIHTIATLGGIQTPITLDKFKLLVNIECQLKLTKCDDESQTNLNYKQYRHIKKACPASHKLKFNY